MTELLNTLYVQTPGTSLHLDGDTVRIRRPDDDRTQRLPLVRVDHIVAFGGVNISQDLQLRCAADGRSLTWMSGFGKFRARVIGPVVGNPLLRHAQHQAHDDNPRRLEIAKRFVAGKLHNTRQLLLRAARDTSGQRQTSLRKAADAQATALHEVPNAQDVDTLFGIEGRAARDHFEAVPHMLTPGTDMAFADRNRRPPTDPVNCLLSFLYGMLRVSVHGALEQVGLDPYLGFLHGLRPGKPALALDLMEEFRPLLADRIALTMLNRKELTHADFDNLPNGAVRLTDNGRRTALAAWQKHRQRAWPHKTLRREVPAALLPLVQARILARHLRNDIAEYHPWRPT